MATPRDDSWKAGELYEPYVGRWSRRVAERFLAWLGVPAARAWLDIGCGTGALTEAILAIAAPASIRACDSSEGFIEHARRHVRSPSVRFEIADARSLPVGRHSVDATVSGLVLNFIPEPATVVDEMKRVTRPRGTVAAYVWDYAGRMELMRYFWDTAVELDADAAALDEGRRFPICGPQPLARLFDEAGLGAVEVEAIEIDTRFRGFDDYWTPFLGGQGPAPAYVTAQSEELRVALRERLRARLPIRADGTIHLVARAWAVRGTPYEADRLP